MNEIKRDPLPGKIVPDKPAIKPTEFILEKFLKDLKAESRKKTRKQD